ncbi:hypothetical protein G3M48_000890 [Beauveria asiatica]|uniref:Uncharacterized protein n=1 Tax=Beauveria asiatica TaxID=1069075 RepID=A0AAW0S058_9HYPO
MHSLQTYGDEKTFYDGNAHAFSSTYHDGTLKLYTHHVTAPTAEGERPEYHMTQLRTFGMTDTRETFLAGATAVRNARDLARRQREDFVQTATDKVSQSQKVATVKYSAELQDDNLSHGHLEHSETAAWQDSHDDLQQHIAETHDEVNEDHGDAPTTPQQQQSSDESDDQGQDTAASVANDPSTSFLSNFTSTFNTDSTRPKRSRLSFSSPTQGSRSSKSRSRFTTTRQRVVSPAAIGEPDSSDSNLC